MTDEKMTRETPKQIAARVRERLPDFLKDPATIEANDRRQAALRASYSRARLSEGERLLARGAQLEEVARANIAQMEAHREDRHVVSTRGGANLDMLKEQHAVLAHALELQGRYEEAAEVAPLKTEQTRLRKIHEAVERDDAMCDCPRDEHELGGATIEISPRRPLKPVYSRRHGDAVALTWCEKCETYNARPLTGQAAEIAGARGGQARPDVQVLRAAK